ncbi:putative quinol monooxygenase [Frankia gtarii]|uniref:putative quinol monooxygenase n=1 Tax=Frankia gtarii TaxID=2950102 RepID=UPI0021BFD000|nr:antibiotic biosynthesis monooxygenase family protein [Frankia gtarii]
MAVSSVFDLRFSPESAQEGVDLARAIGADMPATAGCTGYDVIRDLADPGHVVIVTRWNTRGDGEAVLGSYFRDPKITRVTELLGHVPTGFLGELADK